MTLAQIAQRLEKRGYTLSRATVGNSGCVAVDGTEYPDMYRDALTVDFRTASAKQNGENDAGLTLDFIRAVERLTGAAILSHWRIYQGERFIVTDTETAAELTRDSQIKEAALNEFWQRQHSIKVALGIAS